MPLSKQTFAQSEKYFEFEFYHSIFKSESGAVGRAKFPRARAGGVRGTGGLEGGN